MDIEGGCLSFTLPLHSRINSRTPSAVERLNPRFDLLNLQDVLISGVFEVLDGLHWGENVGEDARLIG